MLQSHTGKTAELVEQGFLISVELEENAQTIDFITNKIAESLTWVEGVGRTDVHYLGPIEVVPEEANGR